MYLPPRPSSPRPSAPSEAVVPVFTQRLPWDAERRRCLFGSHGDVMRFVRGELLLPRASRRLYLSRRPWVPSEAVPVFTQR